jgi:hypothetical protein
MDGFYQVYPKIPDHCNFRADVVIFGDSAPLPPVLFVCGVDAESGTKVENANIALWS